MKASTKRPFFSPTMTLVVCISGALLLGVLARAVIVSTATTHTRDRVLCFIYSIGTGGKESHAWCGVVTVKISNPVHVSTRVLSCLMTETNAPSFLLWEETNQSRTFTDCRPTQIPIPPPTGLPYGLMCREGLTVCLS